MKNLITTLKELFGVEEILFLLGIVMLYAGLAAQYGHAIAQAASGFVLIAVSVMLVFKGS